MTQTIFSWNHAVYKLKNTLEVNLGTLQIKPEDLIVLTGGNGSGKTSVARALGGELELKSGTAPENLHPALVSFEKQIQLFEADYNLRNNDMATAKEEHGITPRDLLKGAPADTFKEVTERLGITALLDSPLRLLSGGEGRKVLLAEALCSRPNLLIFDTPFDALDTESRNALKELIERLHTRARIPVVLIINRPSEIPDSLTCMGIIQDLGIARILGREAIASDPDAQGLLGYARLPDMELPAPPVSYRLPPLKSPILAELKNVCITYSRVIFDHLNFTVKQGEHWHILGPNGAGKSTLLSLITGDNPLVYTNDITVFGFKRGCGESVWDIKKYFGVVSGALHLDYRVNAPALNVVLSGFYDSIGLYRRPSGEETALARRWLKLCGLAGREHMPFRSLSFGQQRMLLIIRALIKNPPLLILDEALQGLDGFARALVRYFISYIMKNGRSTVLFVSHHEEDIPEGFTHRLQFISNGKGGYNIVQEKLDTHSPASEQHHRPD